MRVSTARSNARQASTLRPKDELGEDIRIKLARIVTLPTYLGGVRINQILGKCLILQRRLVALTPRNADGIPLSHWQATTGVMVVCTCRGTQLPL